MASNSTSLGETIRELWELLRSYARQETIDPLKGLGWYLAYGVPAALLTSLGLGLLLLGALRLLQSEGGRWLDAVGDSSPLPYLAVVVLVAAAGGILGSRVRKEFGGKR